MSTLINTAEAKTKESKDKDESTIKTILRIRPSKQASNYFRIDQSNSAVLHFNLPETYKASSDYINNTKLHHSFQFHDVLPMETPQAKVFEKVGIEAVQNALQGFNSTIFAYGQTGSGKTFTLTGGQDQYEDRGIIPRALTMLFKEVRKGRDMAYKFYISYMEIYNEQGHDLLGGNANEGESNIDARTGLEILPKVSMLEDEHGNFHIKNLSMHPADSEKDALELLFIGDTNRAVAETPMNLASSRSHCIFTISIEGRLPDSERIRRSKLHLVDLAGSERVSKTNSSGKVLEQAKYINSSLFYLEMVIVALHEKATRGRSHIPYRNSMMTSALRDSLGGNCKTVMIATINPEALHTEESLSTCRFAQRVSMIRNKAVINEDVDPSIVIRKLKNEMLNLREEIGFLKGETGEGDSLTPIEFDDLKKKCRDYCFDLEQNSTLDIGKLTLTKIKNAFSIFKSLVIEEQMKYQNNTLIDSSKRSSSLVTQDSKDKEIEDLQALLLQRDNEIAILVNMVKKGVSSDDISNAISSNSFKDTKPSSNISRKSLVEIQHQKDEQRESAKEELFLKRHLHGVPPPPDSSILEDAAVSFEYFRIRCNLYNAMEENKNLLKEKIQEAKLLGEKANRSRNTITYLKSSIEAIRKEKLISKIKSESNDTKDSSDDSLVDISPEEDAHRRAIEQEKIVFKETYDQLGVLKPTIENIKKMLENSRKKMQLQFDEWYQNLHFRGHDNNQSATNTSHDSMSVRTSFESTSSSNNSTISSKSKAIITPILNVPLVKNLVSSESKQEPSVTTFSLESFMQAKEELSRRKKNQPS